MFQSCFSVSSVTLWRLMREHSLFRETTVRLHCRQAPSCEGHAKVKITDLFLRFRDSAVVIYAAHHVVIHNQHRIAATRRSRLPPPAEFSATAHIKSMEELEALRAEAAPIRKRSGRAWLKGTPLVQEVGHGSEVGTAARAVVRRRQNQYFLQLSRPTSGNLAAQQGRADLGRRARRTAHAHLSATAHAKSANLQMC